MSYEFYLWLHITSLIAVFSCLGAQIFYVANGGNKQTWAHRKLISMTHGIALLVALIAGFGLIAKGGYSFTRDTWLYVKLASWLFVGGVPALIWRKAAQSLKIFYACLAVAAIAAAAAIFKF